MFRLGNCYTNKTPTTLKLLSVCHLSGDMVQQGTFVTPTGIFLISMTIMYLVTAILHPQEFTMIIYGLMYFICIPSGYLLLTIYSLVNMHIVSWGTRESSKAKETQKRVGVLCDRTCKLCCWDMTCQVTQETESLLLQQIQHAVGPNGQPAAAAAPATQGVNNANVPHHLEMAELKTTETGQTSKGPGRDLDDSGSEKRYSLLMCRLFFTVHW